VSKYVIVDSREKPKAIERTLQYFSDHGIEYEVSKLLFGDYMDWNRPGVVVDRKQNIAELAKNCTVEHERFRREMEKARKAGAVLVVLVEQNRYKDRGEWVEVDSIEDLLRWSSPHTMVRGEKVYRVLASWTAKYPLRVEFCDKRSTGRRIAEILYRDENEQNQG
jgi:ERCC4-type nuclease